MGSEKVSPCLKQLGRKLREEVGIEAGPGYICDMKRTSTLWLWRVVRVLARGALLSAERRLFQKSPNFR